MWILEAPPRPTLAHFLLLLQTHLTSPSSVRSWKSQYFEHWCPIIPLCSVHDVPLAWLFLFPYSYLTTLYPSRSRRIRIIYPTRLKLIIIIPLRTLSLCLYLLIVFGKLLTGILVSLSIDSFIGKQRSFYLGKYFNKIIIRYHYQVVHY